MGHKKINPELLGFDFDGVIANIAEVFIRIACEDYGYCSFGVDDIIDFDVETCLNIPLETTQEIFTRIVLDSISTGLQPMEGAVEVIGSLTKKASVTIITARPDPAPVEAWLDTVFQAPVRRNIKTIAMGEHDGKFHYIQQEGLHYFIDDRPQTCKQLEDEGITPLLFSQPWNRSKVHSFTTVKTWKEIQDICLSKGR